MKVHDSSASFRLFQIMAGARHGGAELFFERLALAFHEQGMKQHLYIKNHPERLKQLAGAGIMLTPASFSPRTRLFERHKLKKAITAFESDVVLSWMNRATSFTPQIKQTHVARLGGYYDLKYYRKCDWLVANTKGIADYLVQQGWPAHKTHHQVNFVPDGTKVQPIVLPADAKNKLILASLGRLHKNKGFDVLIKAIAGLKDVYLLLAGDGPEKPALQQLAAEQHLTDRICFLGWQDNPQAVIKAADIFICPSRHEPFGNVIAEAFATNRPVIATASQGAREFINADTDGLLVDVDDTGQLADAIKILMTDERQRKKLASAGHKSWQASFTKQAVTQNWIRFLKEVA